MPLFGKKKNYDEMTAEELFSEASQAIVDNNATQLSDILMKLYKSYPEYEKGRSLMADILMGGEKYSFALPHLEYLAGRYPNNAKYVGSLGLCLILLDRMDEGKAALQRALEIDPANERFRKVLDTMV